MAVSLLSYFRRFGPAGGMLARILASAPATPAPGFVRVGVQDGGADGPRLRVSLADGDTLDVPALKGGAKAVQVETWPFAPDASYSRPVGAIVINGNAPDLTSAVWRCHNPGTGANDAVWLPVEEGLRRRVLYAEDIQAGDFIRMEADAAYRIVAAATGDGDTISSIGAPGRVADAAAHSAAGLMTRWIGDKLVTVYAPSGLGVWAAVGIVSGTDIQWGDPVQITSSLYDGQSILLPTDMCPLTSDTFLLAINNKSTSSWVQACRITGTAIDYGEAVKASSSVYSPRVTRFTGEQALLYWLQGMTNNYERQTLVTVAADLTVTLDPGIKSLPFSGTAAAPVNRLLTVDSDRVARLLVLGTSTYMAISRRNPDGSTAMNATVQVGSGAFVGADMLLMGNGTRILHASRAGSTVYLATRICELSGDTITPNAQKTFQVDAAVYQCALQKLSEDKAMLFYWGGSDSTPGALYCRVLDCSGTVVAEGPETLLLDAYHPYSESYPVPRLAEAAADGRLLLPEKKTDDGYKPYVRLIQMGDGEIVSPGAAVGIAQESAAGGSRGLVAFRGAVSEAHSGLLGGNTYWIGPDGQLTDIPQSFVAGTALSSALLLLDPGFFGGLTAVTINTVRSAKISDADGGTSVTADATGFLERWIRMKTAGQERLVISAAGNVGIGDSQPPVALSVNGGVKIGELDAPASAALLGVCRVVRLANEFRVQICAQTGPDSYVWVSLAAYAW